MNQQELETKMKIKLSDLSIQQKMENNNLLPKKPAIYSLYDVRDRLIYIGCTKNLFNRIKRHKNRFPKKYHLNYLLYKTFSYHGLIRFRQELFLIKISKPLAQITERERREAVEKKLKQSLTESLRLKERNIELRDSYISLKSRFIKLEREFIKLKEGD